MRSIPRDSMPGVKIAAGVRHIGQQEGWIARIIVFSNLILICLKKDAHAPAP